MIAFRFWERVRYSAEGLRVSTRGLSKRGQEELSVSFDSAELLQEGEAFLRYVVDYLDRTGAKITAGQTLNYGYWLVKFEPVEGALDVWEQEAGFMHFQHGVSLALRYWRDQHEICSLFEAAFDPPNPGDLTAISSGVLEGRPVQAVRYQFGEPMSGWLIVTDQYDGKVNSLTNHHSYHVTSRRPELAKFLALPRGFRFDQAAGERVWFDAEVANQETPNQP